MNIITWLDSLLIRFANYRAALIPRFWTALDTDGGRWQLGMMNLRKAEKIVLEGGKNKIIWTDADEGYIFYK